ncbi:MAG TPA: histidine kinase [Actinomycetota bacterium]
MSARPATDPVSRSVRWPWVVFGLGVAIASVGLVLVSVNGRALTGEVTNFLAFMGMGVVGALSLSRAPRNVIGFLMLWVAVSAGLAFAMAELSAYLYARGDLEAAIWVGWPGSTLWALGLFPLLILLPLLFPDGRLLSRRWRPVLRAGLAVSGLAFLVIGFAAPIQVITIAGRDVEMRNPLAIPGLEGLGELGWVLWPALLALFVVSAASMVVRFRRSRGVERQQLKWFAFAATVLLVYFLASAVLEALEISEGTVGQVISGLAFAGLPVAVGVAILQYRLWDLDVVVKKTVVAGSLVLLAIAVYAGAVASIGLLAIDQDRPAVLFAIALGLGIAFRPAMRVGRRIADRLVYGRRATPYEVLTEFSERMGTSFATEDVLPRMAQVLGEGTGAETARVWLLVGGELHPAAAWPPDASPAEPVTRTRTGFDIPGEALAEVRDRGELLGALSVRMPASDPMSPSKEKLVYDLAAQAGMVLRNVRLVEDLRTSRQRLVAAQDEERRRLERNIHDGAQQQLVALAVKARLAGQLAERDPAKTVELLAQIEAETQTALEDLRDLARGIYPPLLADRGLVAAIEAQSRKSQLGVEVEADGLGRFPADVEATVYFCTLEALQNIAKYAAADRTVIRLARANGSLSFEVEDDGLGFDPTTVGSGSGLQGMADRLAAVGGSLDIRSAPGRGTTVAGRVPVAGR